MCGGVGFINVSFGVALHFDQAARMASDIRCVGTRSSSTHPVSARKTSVRRGAPKALISKPAMASNAAVKLFPEPIGPHSPMILAFVIGMVIVHPPLVLLIQLPGQRLLEYPGWL